MRFKDELQEQLYFISQIDYCYWRLQQISEDSSKTESPLAALIDEATGFDKAKIKDLTDQSKYLVSTIIRCKKKLEFDAKGDKELLKKLAEL
jgi:hypothetical protein